MDGLFEKVAAEGGGDDREAGADEADGDFDGRPDVKLRARPLCTRLSFGGVGIERGGMAYRLCLLSGSRIVLHGQN